MRIAFFLLERIVRVMDVSFVQPNGELPTQFGERLYRLKRKFFQKRIDTLMVFFDLAFGEARELLLYRTMRKK